MRLFNFCLLNLFIYVVLGYHIRRCSLLLDKYQLSPMDTRDVLTRAHRVVDRDGRSV